MCKCKKQKKLKVVYINDCSKPTVKCCKKEKKCGCKEQHCPSGFENKHRGRGCGCGCGGH